MKRIKVPRCTNLKWHDSEKRYFNLIVDYLESKEWFCYDEVAGTYFFSDLPDSAGTCSPGHIEVDYNYIRDTTYVNYCDTDEDGQNYQMDFPPYDEDEGGFIISEFSDFSDFYSKYMESHPLPPINA